LLGGETAELPGVYESGELDLAGTIVGVVDREYLVDGTRIQSGDVVLALPSNGLHTNGYSLARRVLDDLNWNEVFSELGGSVGDVLLAIHRSYLEPVQRLWASGVDIRGMAHITGGGVIDNLPRILPSGAGAVIQRGTWFEPPIFGLMQELGNITDDEMFHVFNMGLGMLIVVAPDQAEVAKTVLEEIDQVGVIVSGSGVAVEQG
jgi:phosphoribosylformylglycinamidine cyclo-ligase